MGSEQASDLAKRLRDCLVCSGSGQIVDPFSCVTLSPGSIFPPLKYIPCPHCRRNRQAADMLESQAAEIARLKADHINNLDATVNEMNEMNRKAYAERDQLAAELRRTAPADGKDQPC